jgi:hypothetical protein
VAPLLRPFVIPEGTYGELTPTPVATVAMDTLLVAHRDTPRVVVYDLMQVMQLMSPRLLAQRPDLQVAEFDDFEVSHLTFPVHPGALAYRARNEPGFFERATGILEGIVAALAAIGTIFLALVRYLRSLRKTRIDELYAQALAIRARTAGGLRGEERRRSVTELQALRESAFRLLIDEKLRADESFRILQSLMSEVLEELQTSGTAEEAPIQSTRASQ